MNFDRTNSLELQNTDDWWRRLCCWKDSNLFVGSLVYFLNKAFTTGWYVLVSYGSKPVETHPHFQTMFLFADIVRFVDRAAPQYKYDILSVRRLLLHHSCPVVRHTATTHHVLLPPVLVCYHVLFTNTCYLPLLFHTTCLSNVLLTGYAFVRPSWMFWMFLERLDFYACSRTTVWEGEIVALFGFWNGRH